MQISSKINQISKRTVKNQSFVSENPIRRLSLDSDPQKKTIKLRTDSTLKQSMDPDTKTSGISNKNNGNQISIKIFYSLNKLN